MDPALTTLQGFFSPSVLPGGTLPNPNIEPIDPRTGLQAPLLPGGTTTAGFTGGGSTGPTAAEIAAAAKVANLIKGYDVTQGGIQAGGRQSATDVGNTYDTNTRTFLSGLQTGQDTLNSNRANNFLNLRRGMASIASGVRQGLRSGGVQLGNMNALDSGAAEALARAWARAGNTQTADARNQFTLGNSALDTQQGTLNRQRDDTLYGLDRYKATELDRISNDVLNKLQVLDTQAQGDGTGWHANMGIRDSIINDAIARLNAIDQMRADRLAAVHGLTPEEAAAKAVEMDQAGAVGSSPFAIEGPTVNTPGGIGADISQLPIFTQRRKQFA